MAPAKKTPAASKGPNLLASLRETKMIATLKPTLPAEILAMILDLLPVPDLLSFARTARRMREMVYDDTRWIQRLRCMACWNEAEARQRFDDSMRRKLEAQRARHSERSRRALADHTWGLNGASASASAGVLRGPGGAGTTLFDAGWEEQAPRALGLGSSLGSGSGSGVGVGVGAGAGAGAGGPYASTSASPEPAVSAVSVFTTVRSVRAAARAEYGKVYRVLAPLYFDIVQSRRPDGDDAWLFREFAEPEEQAQVLANLNRFCRSDWAQGWRYREEQLESITGVFENALLREFNLGCEANEYDGRMKRYANVLVMLNGGSSGIDAYIQHHRLMREKDSLGNPLECLEGVAYGHVDLGPSRDFFQHLARNLNEEAGIVVRVFPPSIDVLTPFLDRVADDIINEYLVSLFDEAHRTNSETYLKAVSGVFEQTFQFAQTLKPSARSKAGFSEHVSQIVVRVFEPHLDLYLSEEVGFFRRTSNEEVERWEKQLSDQEASAESFFMSNVSRQAEKRDFLSSFKKVVMMPVSVLTINPNPSQSQLTTGKSHPRDSLTNGGAPEYTSRAGTPRLQAPGYPGRPTTPSQEAPTTELAAKAAIMHSKLEGIKTLFSIEVALSLLHSAKSSIERCARFVKLGGQWKDEAQMQCETVFVDLLAILGFRHIKPGFDKAVNHLANYNTHEAAEHGQSRVEPLVTFLELVNVGDLIQQMIDVFYAQELVAKNLTDPDDFLDVAVKEKKKFEQMLDERVAAGLNKGIDVLIREVEHICSTTQVANEFNPEAAGDDKDGLIDVEPSSTARQVVELVSYHTGMLAGSTDKNMLDVFNQEVGMRLFTAVCKNMKRQRISTSGAIKLISDINHYSSYIQTLRNKELMEYFRALRELSQIFLIDSSHAKEIATIVADGDRYRGIFRAEEVYEFAQRRADWYQIKTNVERQLDGGCQVM